MTDKQADLAMDNPYDYDMMRISAHCIKSNMFIMISEEDIERAEMKIGYRLPLDYRTFLKKYGFVVGAGNTVFGNMDDPSRLETSVDNFYGIMPGDGDDIVERIDVFGGRLPNRFIPIASGSGGDFCLSLAGEDSGQVYWWPMHGDADDLDLVSRSFDSFVKSLQILEE